MSLLITIQVAVMAAARSVRSRLPRLADRARPESGQATAEYALVLLGAAAVALLLAAWAAQSGQIGRLFDAIVGQLIDRAG
jgi:Flp pilus assembly pilin Flp